MSNKCQRFELVDGKMKCDEWGDYIHYDAHESVIEDLIEEYEAELSRLKQAQESILLELSETLEVRGLWSPENLTSPDMIMAVGRALDTLKHAQEWIFVSDRRPDPEPHRNIQIAYTDAGGKKFTGEASSWLGDCLNYYAWREINAPEPPKEQQSDG